MAIKTADETKSGNLHQKFLDDPEFKKLRSSRTGITAVLTVLTLITYYGYIFLLAYGKSALSAKIGANITLGLPIGVAVIIISWALTFTYAMWANTKYDQMVAQLKSKLGG